MNSLLSIGAHPDDETRLAGGTLAMLAQQGVTVHILCATRGEGGEMGDPPVSERRDLGRVREAELRCAASQLGAASISFLNYVDPVCEVDGELFAFEADPRVLAARIRDAIDRLSVDVVLTHGSNGEYGHPAHVLVHNGVREAVESSRRRPLLYSWAAQAPGFEDRILNQDDPAHLVLDVRPWFDILERATDCHQSQMAMFRRRREAQTTREVLRTNEAFHRHLPPLDSDVPEDGFADRLRAAGAWSPQ